MRDREEITLEQYIAIISGVEKVEVEGEIKRGDWARLTHFSANPFISPLSQETINRFAGSIVQVDRVINNEINVAGNMWPVEFCEKIEGHDYVNLGGYHVCITDYSTIQIGAQKLHRGDLEFIRSLWDFSGGTHLKLGGALITQEKAKALLRVMGEF